RLEVVEDRRLSRVVGGCERTAARPAQGAAPEIGLLAAAGQLVRGPVKLTLLTDGSLDELERLLRLRSPAQRLQVLAHDRVTAVEAVGGQLLVQAHGGEVLVLREPGFDLVAVAVELRPARHGLADGALERGLPVLAPRLELLEQPAHGVAVDRKRAADRAFGITALFTPLHLVGEAAPDFLIHRLSRRRARVLRVPRDARWRGGRRLGRDARSGRARAPRPAQAPPAHAGSSCATGGSTPRRSSARAAAAGCSVRRAADRRRQRLGVAR